MRMRLGASDEIRWDCVSIRANNFFADLRRCVMRGDNDFSVGITYTVETVPVFALSHPATML